MTFVTAATPALNVYAQSPRAQLPRVEQTELPYCLPGACVVVSARPQQLLTSPLLKMMPIEVLQATMLQETGLDPLEGQRLLVSILPSANPPSFSVSA